MHLSKQGKGRRKINWTLSIKVRNIFKYALYYSHLIDCIYKKKITVPLGKPQKKSFFSGPTTKTGGGVRARPLRKKGLFFIFIYFS